MEQRPAKRLQMMHGAKERKHLYGEVGAVEAEFEKQGVNKHQKDTQDGSGRMFETDDRRAIVRRTGRGSLQSPSQKLTTDREVFGGRHSLDDPLTRPISGQRLDRLLEMLGSALNMEIGAKDSLPKTVLMRKVKKCFCIGINNVTRTLERMPMIQNKVHAKGLPNLEQFVSIEDGRSDAQPGCCQKEAKDVNCTEHGAFNDESGTSGKKDVHLQAVLVASDVHPRLLVSHLPALASSRNVPLLTISGGNGTGSIRLGQVLNVRTAIAVGLKKGDSAINAVIKSFLDEGS